MDSTFCVINIDTKSTHIELILSMSYLHSLAHMHQTKLFDLWLSFFYNQSIFFIIIFFRLTLTQIHKWMDFFKLPFKILFHTRKNKLLHPQVLCRMIWREKNHLQFLSKMSLNTLCHISIFNGLCSVSLLYQIICPNRSVLIFFRQCHCHWLGKNIYVYLYRTQSTSVFSVHVSNVENVLAFQMQTVMKGKTNGKEWETVRRNETRQAKNIGRCVPQISN